RPDRSDRPLDVIEKRPCDDDRDRWIVNVVPVLARYVELEKCLEFVARGLQNFSRGSSYAGHLRREELTRVLATPEDQTEVIVALFFRGVQERVHPDTAVLLRHALRGSR